MVKRNHGLLKPVTEEDEDDAVLEEGDRSDMDVVSELWNDFISQLESAEGKWKELVERIEVIGHDSLPIRLQRWFARGPMRGHFHYAISFLFEEIEMAKGFETLYLKGESDE